MKKNVFFIALIALTGCVSNSNIYTVLQKSSENTPVWAKDTQQGYPCIYKVNAKSYVPADYEKATHICMTGEYVVPASKNTNLASVKRSSEMTARAEFARVFNSSLAQVISETDEAHSLSQQEVMSSLAAKFETEANGMLSTGRYWEKTQEVNDDGNSVMYHYYTQVAMSKKDFNDAIKENGKKYGLSRKAEYLQSETLKMVLNGKNE